MTICGIARGIHGTQTDTPILTAGVATAIGDLLFGTPIPGHGAVAIGTDTIHITEATVTEPAITMVFGMDTMQASTTHTMVTMSIHQLTTLMVV